MPAYIFKMRFIENYELREWVKDNLRKTIFQKAHALAVQTGCEILVKLEDNEAITGSQYYATDTLENVFNGDGLRKKPDDMSVSGDTGLPIATMVDRAIQSAEAPSESTGGALPSASSQSVEDIAHRLSSKATTAGGDCAVPMQLTLVQDSFAKPNSQSESSPVQATQTEPSLEQQSGDATSTEITVKIEPMTEDEPPDPGLSSNGDTGTQQADANQMSFSMDTSNQSMLGMGYSGPSQEVIGGMTRDTKLYPVPISPKPYQCAVCQKAFRSVQVLQKHTQTFHMRPHSMQLLSKRGRGRGRGAYSRSSAFQHHQLASQTQTPRYLCVICNRVFREAHLLEDHMARSHMGRATPQSSQSSFDESIASQLTALTGDISFQQEDNSLTLQNPEDIPGPSSVDESSIPMTQMPAGAPVPFGQPQCSVNAPLTHPPPPMYSGFTAPAAPVRTSTSMPGSSHQGGTPSRGKAHGNQRFKRSASLIHDIMSAILLTAGPVTSYVSFSRRAPTSLRTISKDQFYAAANMLQAAHLGTVASVMNVSRQSSAFVKIAPAEAQEGLAANPNLITPEKYAERYYTQTPSCISQNMREKLVAMGLLTQEQADDSHHGRNPRRF